MTAKSKLTPKLSNCSQLLGTGESGATKSLPRNVDGNIRRTYQGTLSTMGGGNEQESVAEWAEVERIRDSFKFWKNGLRIEFGTKGRKGK